MESGIKARLGKKKLGGGAAGPGRKPNFVVTGLGQINDARQKITQNQKQTGKVGDAREKIMLKTKFATDARAKIESKRLQKVPESQDARNKIKQPMDARQLIKKKQVSSALPTQVTVTGLGRVLSSSASGVAAVHSTQSGSLFKTITVDDTDAEDSGSFIAGQIIKTIRNTAPTQCHDRITDLIITARNSQAKPTQRISPVRAPKAKEARPPPIRPQAAALRTTDSVIRLNQSHSPPKPKHVQARPVAPKIQAVQEPKVHQSVKQTTDPLPSSDVVSPIQGFRLVISNLGEQVTQEDIVELFGSLGAMKKARLLKPGHAEVVYVKKEDASGAIRQYHMRELDGLPMSVVFSNPSPPAPPKPVIPTPSAAAESAPAGPLKLSKGSSSSKQDSEIDPSIIHLALFKSKEKKHSGKPVSFTVKI